MGYYKIKNENNATRGMVYEAERLIDKRFGRVRRRWIVRTVSHLFAALLGAGVTLLIVILIRKI